MSDYEYEDELERMRARRKQKSAGSKGRESDDWDFDLITELEEDAPGSPGASSSKRRGGAPRKSMLERAADRYVDAPEPEYYDDYEEEAEPVRAPRRPLKQKRSGKGKLLKLILLVILLVAGFLFARRWMKDRDGYWNIAVFGVDSRSGGLEKDSLADVQMLASINKKTGEIRLVSVYRDTYVQIDDKGTFHKINEAYFKGGHKQALDTLKRNLDVSVDDYATFNWKAVADAINILGGVDLELTDSEFRYINSFITETVESTGVYSTHLKSAGMNHLDGVQAVAYSRLRLMDTDFNRTERQRKVVMLALEKAKQADLNTLQTVVRTVIPEISTSIGVEDVITIAKDVSHYYLGQTAGFPFAKTTADVGKLDCVIPMTLESNVVLLHQFLFEDTGYTASSSVKKISAAISEKTGVYEEGKSAGSDGNLNSATGSKDSSGSGASGNAGNSGSGNSGSDGSAQTAAETETSTELETETAIESESTEEGNGHETSGEEATKAENVPTSVPAAPLELEETTKEAETNGTIVYDKKPAETTAESYGPGFDSPSESPAAGDSVVSDGPGT